MSTTAAVTTPWRSLLEERRGRGPDPDPRMERLRRESWDRFEAVGFPTTRAEAWKYTSVAEISGTSFSLPAPQAVGVPAALPLAGLRAVRLVFLDGNWCRELSDPLPASIRVLDVSAALDAGLGQWTATDHAFAALNTALFADGAFLEVLPGTRADRPVHIIHAFNESGGPTLVSPRTLVRIGDGAQLRLIETYGPAPGVFANAVTEILCGEDAELDHVRVELGGDRSRHVGVSHFEQARASVVRSTTVTFGGRLVRNDCNVVLKEPGAEVRLNGVYVAGGRDHVDNHTRIDHAADHTRSRELYTGILGGRSTGVFNGAIVVRREAQRSVSGQQNRNLLLSDDAVIDTKPELEIYADDVKCTHGATIGQLDGDALFYLRTRGFDLEAARKLLTEAFASAVFDAIGSEELEAALMGFLRERLRTLTRGGQP